MPETPRHRVIAPPELGPARGYANGILVPPGAALLLVAGQIGWDAEQRLVEGGLAPQFLQALDNLLTVVTAAGGRPADVVRMTVFVTDKAAYVDARRELAAGWRERFGRHYPAMTLVEVRSLLEPGALVEIEATAAMFPSPTP
jgi:enamine deaminase RidA (YjgF/YER057c/UK114 family)